MLWWRILDNVAGDFHDTLLCWARLDFGDNEYGNLITKNWLGGGCSLNMLHWVLLNGAVIHQTCSAELD